MTNGSSNGPRAPQKPKSPTKQKPQTKDGKKK